MSKELVRSVVTVETRVVIHHKLGIDPLEDVMVNCDYHFMSQNEGARIADTELMGWELSNSRPLFDNEFDNELDGGL